MADETVDESALDDFEDLMDARALRRMARLLNKCANTLEENIDLKKKLADERARNNKNLDVALEYSRMHSGLLLKAALDGVFRDKKDSK